MYMGKNTSTILLCEDELFVARSYIRKLELEGYTVVHVKNGNEAISYLEKHTPDLILLDLMMPIVSGFEVLKHIKENSDAKLKAVPIIVASNLGQKSDIEEATKLGAGDFLIKSNISLKELAEKVAERIST